MISERGTWVVVSVMVSGFLVCGPGRCESWPGYEGLRHQSSSAVAPEGTLEVKWEKRYTNLSYISDSTTWGITGYMHSRNLAWFNGMIAWAINDDEAYPDYSSGNRGPLTILDASDGSVINCVMTRQTHGGYKNMWDATETGLGEQIVSWDPDTGIVFLSIGGDMPGHSAILPLANADTYSGSYQSGVGAYEQLYGDHPGFRSSRNHVRDEETSVTSGSPPLPPNEWDSQNTYPNRCGFFDMQPGSPYMVICKGAGHGDAQADDFANKYSGMCAKENWDQYTYADCGFPIFKMWSGQLVDGNRIYYMGPYEDGATASELCNSVMGLQVACIEMTPTDNYDNDGYSGPAAAETAHPETPMVFHYQYSSPSGDGSAWNESDNNYRNKAWLVAEDGIWVAWHPSESSNIQLVRASETENNTYDLGVGAGLQARDIWPNIAYQDLGAGGKYIVYYLANAMTGTEGTPAPPAGPATITVFDVNAGAVKWTYELNNAAGTGNYPSLPPNPVVLYFECSRMIVAGKYAVVAWVDTTGAGNAVLKVLRLDITAASAPASPPAPFEYDLGIPAVSNGGARVSDLMAVNGVIYALVNEATEVTRYNFLDNQAQRVVAIQPVGLSEIEVNLSISPDSGPARVVSVCDASASTTTAPGGITSWEWDFDYDFITFDVDAGGEVVTNVFDTVGTYNVAVRVTDSTGQSMVRSATVTVGPDEAGDQSVMYTVTEETEINNSENVWNDAGTSSGRMRCSGTYGGDYGTGEHSRGYVNFDAVSLDPAYTLVEARLHFNVKRVNNSGPSTVHRMDPAETLTSSSAWADISSMTGVDQDGGTAGVIEPLDTVFMNTTGSLFFRVTDAAAAWLGRAPYSVPEAQTGFLLCVDDNATPGTLDTGSFYAGEKDSFQWDWDPGECRLEIIYNDPSASTPEVLSDVRPGATAGESYTDASPLEILWGGSGPVTLVDIQYSTASASGPWTTIATGEANDGTFSWAGPVTSGTVWIRITKSGDTTVNAVSANSFEVTGGGPDVTPPTVALTHVSLAGTVDDNASVPATVNVAGTDYTVTDGSWLSADIPVAANPFVIDIQAEDLNSNQTVVQVSVQIP